MRTVTRNSFARQSIVAHVIRTLGLATCANCGGQRFSRGRSWLYRFHVDDDQGARHSGPIAGGKLFCSRGCCESYTGQPFAE
jgi:hypothetical protein